MEVLNGLYIIYIYILYQNAKVQVWTQETQHAKKKTNISYKENKKTSGAKLKEAVLSKG